MSGFLSDGQTTPRPLAPRMPGAPGGQPSAPAMSASERRRVRRACVECRVKKVKCNGAEPCARCTSFRIQCEYGEFPVRSNNTMDPSQVEVLEARLASMEQMFRTFLEQFQMQVNGTGLSAATHQTPTQTAPAAVDRGYTDPNMQQLLAAVEADTTASPRPVNSPIRAFEQDDTDEPPQLGQGQDNNTSLVAETAPEPAETEAEANPADAADPEEDTRHRYADGLGELDVDPYGQLRYVGLGSTVSILENCIGLRRHINRRLSKKGYNAEEPFLASPGATELDPGGDGEPDMAAAADASTPTAEDDELPPPALAEQLIRIYVHDLAFLFPIITKAEIQHIYGRLLSQPRPADRDPGYAAVFYALLAVAAPLLSAEAARAAGSPRTPQQLGGAFYNAAMHYVNTPFRGKHERKGRSQDVVVALGLLSMYLAETGSQAEAWIAVGRAIRNAQDLGLHRSPERLHLPVSERTQRRYIWWCLYILERQLCTALGRPLCVDDQDCDTEVPDDDDNDGSVVGFASMVHLYRIMGQILKMVNSVRNAEAWRRLVHDGAKREELRARVRDANEALQAWATDMVPAAVKTARGGPLLAAKHMALSSFFAAVMLLHRLFMSTPHRPSPLAESQAQRRSAAAATDCIRATAGFLSSVPPSHHVVFHGQYVFMSAIVLLHAVRCSDDPEFVFTALKDVELATSALRRLEGFWRGARKSRATVEEYLHFTFRVLKGNRRGQCLFPCGKNHDHDHSHKKRSSPGCASEAKRPKASQPVQETGPVSQPEIPEMRPPPAPPTPPASLCSRDVPPTAAVPPMETVPMMPPLPQISAPPMPVVLDVPPLQDTHFDDTIGNFLGAISDNYFEGYPDMDLHGLNFVSPDGSELQNFFF